MRVRLVPLIAVALLSGFGVNGFGQNQYHNSDLVVQRGHSYAVLSVAFSPDGEYALTGAQDNTAKLWEVETQRRVRTFFGHTEEIRSVAFSPDGRHALTGSFDDTIKLWNVSTGDEIRTFTGHSDSVRSVAFSPDGRHVVTGSWDQTAKLWDVETGAQIQELSGHIASVDSLTFTPNGQSIVTGSSDGTMRYWNAETGEEIYAAIATADDRSLSWTPEGYFAGDESLAREAVYFIDGMRTIGINQFFDQFYRPDIIEARIAGRDLTELVGDRTAAESIVPLPEVSIEVERSAGVFRGVSREGIGTGGDTAADYHVVNGAIRVRVTARDTGGGAEEIRFFHNGVRVGGDARGLAAVGRPQATDSGELVQEFTIRLAQGENTLRTIAFTETRIESSPAVIELAYQAPHRVEPTLWVLAVGINEYRNPRYNLNYAVGDARGFVEAVEHSSSGLFTEVETQIITNAESTRENIIAAFERIEARSSPEDLFMFFYAGHGIVLRGEGDDQGVFHFVTPGVTQMTRPDLVTRLGISSPELSELVARLPPRRHLMVIDACHAGAALGDFAFRGAAEEQALARLQRASGTAMLAASREDQFAQEFDVLGQGALTRTVIDGLMGAAGPAKGQITVLDILRYADEQVPRLTEEHLGQPQFAQFFSPPQDFPVGIR